MTSTDHTSMRNETSDLPARKAQKTDWRRTFGMREMGVYYALLLLVTVLSLMTFYTGSSNYLSVQNMTNVIYQASLTSIMAVAMTVVLISGNFDLSVASVAALAGAVLIGNVDTMGFVPAVGVAMLVAVAIGLLNGVIVQFVGINAFIVTLGTMTAVRGLVLIYTDGRSLAATDPDVLETMKSVEGGKHDVGLLVLALGVVLLAAGVAAILRARRNTAPIGAWQVGLTLGGVALLALSWATGGELVLRNPVLYMAAFTAVVWFVLTFTMVGRRLYSVGGNAEAARLSGINVNRYKLMCFVLSAGAAGFAGILFASRLKSINPAGLEGAELTVIAAAILGGTSLFGGAGSVIKTLAGALLLYSLTNGFNILDLGANYQGLIEGIVVVVAAAIYTVGHKSGKSKTSG